MHLTITILGVNELVLCFWKRSSLYVRTLYETDVFKNINLKFTLSHSSVDLTSKCEIQTEDAIIKPKHCSINKVKRKTQNCIGKFPSRPQ